MSPAIRHTFTVLLALAASAAVPAAASAPVGVSPGELERVAPVDQRCPTFSWTESEGAVGYQLVAYALPADPLAEVVLSSETQVLGRRLPPRATSWTPAADLCFAPGGAYVWFLRAVLEERDGEIVDASEWSEGLHFGLPLAAEGDDADAATGDRRRDRPGAPTRAGAADAAAAGKSERSVVTAAAAIRGDSVDSTGEVHGVIGTTASASGAALAAANTAGGPDLILDGSTQLRADTLLSETGIDRRSTRSETFAITNSGAGSITLAVDGAITGSGAGLTNLDAASLASGSLPSGRLSGTYSEELNFDNPGNTFTGAFSGNGRFLTALEADNITRGTLPSGRLSGTYSGELSFDHPGNTFTGAFSGNGRFLTALEADNITRGTLPSGRLSGTYANALSFSNAGNSVAGTFSGNGSALVGLNAGNLGSGTLPSARLAGTYANALTLSNTGNTFTGDGSGLTGVNAATVGGVAPQALLPGTAWGIYDASVLHEPATAVYQNAITIGADGLGLIAYRAIDTYDALNFAHCDNLTCSSATIHSNQGTLWSGSSLAITIGSDGLPIFSFYNSTEGSLYVGRCNDVECSQVPMPVAVDTEGAVGYGNSISIGADGLGLISYIDADNETLKVAHCTDAECHTPTLTTVTAASFGQTSITVGADGLGLIAFESPTGLRVTYCYDADCSGSSTTTVDSDLRAGNPAIATGSDGRGLVAYFAGSELRVAHCLDLACSSSTTHVLDSNLAAPSGPGMATIGMAIGSDGHAVISYPDVLEGNLKVAHCSDVACSSATTVHAKVFNNVGLFSSIAIGSDGLPLVSYSDLTEDRLLVTHCSNRFCVPHARMR